MVPSCHRHAGAQLWLMRYGWSNGPHGGHMGEPWPCGGVLWALWGSSGPCAGALWALWGVLWALWGVMWSERKFI